jgi:hypothetical protein
MSIRQLLAVRLFATRLCVVLLCVVPAGSGASAQSAAVDCESIKNTTKPVELSYHLGNGVKVILQSYRQASNDYVVWMRTETPNATSVTKSNYVAGVLSESQETTTLQGKRKATVRKFNIEGYPRDFDRRSDIQYKMTMTAAYADGTSDETSVTNSYRFASEGKITYGSCALRVVYGETESTDPKTGKAGARLFQLYLPELKLTLGDPSKQPALDDLRTHFEPLTPIK